MSPSHVVAFRWNPLNDSEERRMRPARFTRPLARVLTAGLLCCIGTAALAQGTGTITGRVTAQGTGAPLSDARVLALGTNLAATTGQDGRYTLSRVRAGAMDVQVFRVGNQPLKKSVTVSAGGDNHRRLRACDRGRPVCRTSSRLRPASSARSSLATLSRPSVTSRQKSSSRRSRT